MENYQVNYMFANKKKRSLTAKLRDILRRDAKAKTITACSYPNNNNPRYLDCRFKTALPRCFRCLWVITTPHLYTEEIGSMRFTPFPRTQAGGSIKYHCQYISPMKLQTAKRTHASPGTSPLATSYKWLGLIRDHPAATHCCSSGCYLQVHGQPFARSEAKPHQRLY